MSSSDGETQSESEADATSAAEQKRARRDAKRQRKIERRERRRLDAAADAKADAEADAKADAEAEATLTALEAEDAARHNNSNRGRSSSLGVRAGLAQSSVTPSPRTGAASSRATATAASAAGPAHLALAVSVVGYKRGNRITLPTAAAMPFAIPAASAAVTAASSTAAAATAGVSVSDLSSPSDSSSEDSVSSRSSGSSGSSSSGSGYSSSGAASSREVTPLPSARTRAREFAATEAARAQTEALEDEKRQMALRGDILAQAMAGAAASVALQNTIQIQQQFQQDDESGGAGGTGSGGGGGVSSRSPVNPGLTIDVGGDGEGVGDGDGVLKSPLVSVRPPPTISMSKWALNPAAPSGGAPPTAAQAAALAATAEAAALLARQNLAQQEALVASFEGMECTPESEAALAALHAAETAAKVTAAEAEAASKLEEQRRLQEQEEALASASQVVDEAEARRLALERLEVVTGLTLNTSASMPFLPSSSPLQRMSRGVGLGGHARVASADLDPAARSMRQLLEKELSHDMRELKSPQKSPIISVQVMGGKTIAQQIHAMMSPGGTMHYSKPSTPSSSSSSSSRSSAFSFPSSKKNKGGMPQLSETDEFYEEATTLALQYV